MAPTPGAVEWAFIRQFGPEFMKWPTQDKTTCGQVTADGQNVGGAVTPILPFGEPILALALGHRRASSITDPGSTSAEVRSDTAWLQGEGMNSDENES